MIDRFVGTKINQPKKEIIKFMASKGVRTVTPYDNPHKIKVGDLWRSEHPQDYEGSSDLFPTATHQKKFPIDGVKEYILSQDTDYIRRTKGEIDLHCKLSGLDYDEFIKGLTYTPWKRMTGTNRVMSADPAVPERYHIITLSPYTAYDVIDGSRVHSLVDRWEGNMIIEEAKGLVVLYEETRGHLDPKHCYIDETMTQKNSDGSYSHFLAQVHRGVDSQKVDFKIGDAWGDINFNYVRGATSSEGEKLLLTVKYPRDYYYSPEIIPEENASIEASTHSVPSVFSEIMFRKRRLQILPIVDDSYFRRELAFHCSRNVLLKPACSVVVYGSNFRGVFGTLRQKEGLVQMPIHFFSDGRKAYLELLR